MAVLSTTAAHQDASATERSVVVPSEPSNAQTRSFGSPESTPSGAVVTVHENVMSSRPHPRMPLKSRVETSDTYDHS